MTIAQVVDPMSARMSQVLDACNIPCAESWSASLLNQDCFCLAIDPKVLHAHLDELLKPFGRTTSLVESHPHLFAALPVYVSRRHIDQVIAAVAAIEQVVRSDAYVAAALAWAPPVALHDPGSSGGLLGFDFHLSEDGPRLIEINTNPGGALLNSLLAKAQRVCLPELVTPPTDVDMAERRIVDILLDEWQAQRALDLAAVETSGSKPLFVIVDQHPASQYLFPEFVLVRELLRARGVDAEICAPSELSFHDARLWMGGRVVAFVYNRLTDFALEDAENAALRSAYLARAVAVSPHPRAHALYADKRNLELLGDRELLRSAGVDNAALATIDAVVPVTTLVTATNRDDLWRRRNALFFKPAQGYGSKGTYRGDKLTRRVWDEIGSGVYVAQERVAPSERNVASDAPALKVDLRCYAYAGEALLHAARMYQGQTTNFRTAGGGFAPVLTMRADE